jgi:hypothetical protein
VISVWRTKKKVRWISGLDKKLALPTFAIYAQVLRAISKNAINISSG